MVSDWLVNFVTQREGFKPYWYDDYDERPWEQSSKRGTRTIGHGLTGNEWNKPSITEAQSREIVRRLLSTIYRAPLDAFLKKIRWEVPEAAREPIISFAYNLGAQWPNVSGFETLQRAFKARDKDAVAKALPLYRNPGTVFEKGLLARRQAEAERWLVGWRQRDPYSWFTPTEAKRVKRLYELRAQAKKRGRWLVSERVEAESIKVYLRSKIGAFKILGPEALAKENRRQRLRLMRDAVANRPLSSL